MTVMNSLKVENMLFWVKNCYLGVWKERELRKFFYWHGRNQNSPLLAWLCHLVQGSRRIQMHSTVVLESVFVRCSMYGCCLCLADLPQLFMGLQDCFHQSQLVCAMQRNLLQTQHSTLQCSLFRNNEWWEKSTPAIYIDGVIPLFSFQM